LCEEENDSITYLGSESIYRRTRYSDRDMSKALLQTQEPTAAAAPPIPPAQPTGPTLHADGSTRLAGALLKRKVTTLFRHFPPALTGDEEAIHQLRVSGRRLRVALPLLVAKPEGRRAERARNLLRQLTQAAGSSRDLDVLLESYDEHLKELPSRSEEQKLLRHRLASARRRSRAHMVDNLLDLEIAQLRGDLAAMIARGGPTPSMVCERFSALSTREFQFLHDGFTKIGAQLDAQKLHALRRRARRVRYSVEVFDQVRNFESVAAKPWKTLQDLIGVIHDYHVLAEWFDAQAKSDRERGKEALAEAARDEAAWARTVMHRVHTEFLAADPIAIIARGMAALGHKATSG
jgi:CHAD domain-containing protein